VAGTLKQHVKEFFRVGPARNDHYVATRVAISGGVPLLALLALGRYDLMVFAAFGCMAGIYGRGEEHGSRLVHQAQAGGLLMLMMFSAYLASLLDGGAWLTVAGVSAVAVLFSLAVNYFELRPAGVVFFIFGFGAIGSAHHTAPLWQAMLTAFLTIVFAILVGISSRLVPSWRTSLALPRRPHFDRARWREMGMEAGMNGLAVAVAGSLATVGGLGHNYWAMVAAVAPLAGPSLTQRMHKGLHRIFGTFAGVGTTALLLFWHPQPWAMVLMVIFMQFMAEMLVIRHYAAALMFITPMALIMAELAKPSEPGPLLVDRAFQTLIGAVVGLALVYAMHRRTLRKQAEGRRLRAPDAAGVQPSATGPAALPETSGSEDGKYLVRQASHRARSSASALAPRP
jgi:hypothetical protein